MQTAKDGDHKLGSLSNHIVECEDLLLRVRIKQDRKTDDPIGQTTSVVRLLSVPLLKVKSAHLIQHWMVKVHGQDYSQEMQVEYSCAHLPNSVGSCPVTRRTYSDSDPVKIEGSLTDPLLNFGSKQLENMESIPKTGFNMYYFQVKYLDNFFYLSAN